MNWSVNVWDWWKSFKYLSMDSDITVPQSTRTQSLKRPEQHVFVNFAIQWVSILTERDAQRASIKRPITIPWSTFDYLTVLSMPQVSFEFLQIAHGGYTGSVSSISGARYVEL